MTGLSDSEVGALRERGWSDAEIAAVDDDLLRDVLDGGTDRSLLSATARTATASVEYSSDGGGSA